MLVFDSVLNLSELGLMVGLFFCSSRALSSSCVKTLGAGLGNSTGLMVFVGSGFVLNSSGDW